MTALEKAARALCRKFVENEPGFYGNDYDIDSLVDLAWGDWLDEVRAVLFSIRTPDEAMRNAARDWSQAKYGQAVGCDGSDGCWQSQIDAIAKETP